MTLHDTTAHRAVAQASTADKATWDAEYADIGAIPSSHRANPSTALAELIEPTDARGTVVDVGCGNGRNAVFLAESADRVVGVDFSREALTLAADRVEASSAVELVRADVRRGLPLPADEADLVVDSYVSCHFLDGDTRRLYLAEVERVLRPGGRLYWSALARSDEYYRQLTGTHPVDAIVVDPLNGVPKQLYTAEEVANRVAGNLVSDQVVEVSFVDTVDGRDYERAILAGLFRLPRDR